MKFYECQMNMTDMILNCCSFASVTSEWKQIDFYIICTLHDKTILTLVKRRKRNIQNLFGHFNLFFKRPMNMACDENSENMKQTT